MSTLAAKLWIDFNSFIVECKADPIGVFRSLSKKTQITIISTTAIASIIMSIALKRKFIRYQMRKLGYRQLDQISYVNQLMQDHNFPITIFGFELADSQRMTLTDTQFFASNIIKYFINFRSEIVNKNGIYYYKETINTDNFNINQFVTYIEMEINDNIQSDIDEFIIQHAVKYVNKQNLINVKWNEYTELVSTPKSNKKQSRFGFRKTLSEKTTNGLIGIDEETEHNYTNEIRVNNGSLAKDSDKKTYYCDDDERMLFANIENTNNHNKKQKNINTKVNCIRKRSRG
eukprot:208355_1